MNKKSVLIIEDDISIAELEKDYLEVNGFSVAMEHSGIKGLDIAIDNTFDLIILDVMLPEVDGFEICRKIREKKNTPILIISARIEDIDKIRGLGLGADDYMTKPFSPNEMVARVKAHIVRYEKLIGAENKSKHHQISIRGLNIDLEARRVTLHQKEILLTTKEYDLLLFLAENPDKVFSKEVLLDRVWGMEHFGDSATVTVHIGKIRDKIEIDGSNTQFIETIWGVGYRFKV